MTLQEFQTFAENNPNIGDAFKRVAAHVPGQSYTVVLEAAMIALLFPVANFIITRLGLPWLDTARHYSELQRQRVVRWIDEAYNQHGFDPDKAEAASNALMDELEATTDAKARSAWERLRDVLGGQK